VHPEEQHGDEACSIPVQSAHQEKCRQQGEHASTTDANRQAASVPPPNAVQSADHKKP